MEIELMSGSSRVYSLYDSHKVYRDMRSTEDVIRFRVSWP